ncbi:MAG: hypothetical protein KDH84_25085, partial [Calditrichaeota bacterium]|nr:hypothetical protein [Calditrichota bacterium]
QSVPSLPKVGNNIVQESHTGIQDVMIPQQGMGMKRSSPHSPKHHQLSKSIGRTALHPHALFKII